MLQIQCETSKSVQTGKFPLEGLLLNLCHMTCSFTPHHNTETRKAFVVKFVFGDQVYALLLVIET